LQCIVRVWKSDAAFFRVENFALVVYGKSLLTSGSAISTVGRKIDYNPNFNPATADAGEKIHQTSSSGNHSQ
jgi:hypothetical protein